MVIGITLFELLGLPPGLRERVPASTERLLTAFSVINHRTIVQPGAIVHEGDLQSLRDAGITLSPSAVVQLPGATRRIPFRLTLPRPLPPLQPNTNPALAGGVNVENAATAWVLDLFLSPIQIVLSGGGIAPAQVVEATGVARHLIPHPTQNRVSVLTGGVVRVTGGTLGDNIDLIAPPDPFDATAPVGTVLGATLIPPHVRMGNSGFGFTLDRVTLDASRTFTPPEIVARGQIEPGWRGLAIDEATLYLPQGMPLVGDVSMGVRDLLVGFDDGSVQGEFEIQLGQAPGSLEDIQFSYEDGSGAIQFIADVHAFNLILLIDRNVVAPVQIRGRLGSEAVARWDHPDGTRVDGRDSGIMLVDPDDDARNQFRFTRLYLQGPPGGGGPLIPGQTWTLTVVRRHDSRSLPPRIGLRFDNGVSFEDVHHVSASGHFLQEATWYAHDPHTGAPLTQDDLDALTWSFDSSSLPTGTGEEFQPPICLDVGVYELILLDPTTGTRRVAIEVLAEGAILVGCHHFSSNPHDANGNTIFGPFLSSTAGEWLLDHPPAPVSAIDATYDKAQYHRTGRIQPGLPEASLDGARVKPADGTLARVRLAGSVARTGALHFRLFYSFDKHDHIVDARCVHGVEQASESTLGVTPPPNGHRYGPSERDTASIFAPPPDGCAADTSPYLDHLVAWAKQFPPTVSFVVIGRCCDITDTTRSRERNEELAGKRANTVKQALVDRASIAASRIVAFGEQDERTHVNRTGLDAIRTDITDRIFDETWLARTELRIQEQFVDPGTGKVVDTGEKRNDPLRRGFRRADIYAVGAGALAWQPGADDTVCVCEHREPTRYTYVPGTDLIPGGVPTEPDPDVPWRLLLKARWDSPSYADDPWIPTLAEARFDWQINPPDAPDMSALQPVVGTGSSEFWSVIARWSWDPRTGRTLASLAWDGKDSADGLARLDADDWAIVFGLGPALLGNVPADSVAEGAVRLGALLAAVAFLENHVQNGSTKLTRLELSHMRETLDGDGRQIWRLTVDYDVSLSIAPAIPPLGLTTDSDLVVRYSNVGIEYIHDDALAWYERVQLVYADSDFAIVSPGTWTLNGALGNLLGVTRVAMGAGSVWFELHLELGIDLGILEVTGAVVRIVFEGGELPTVELRGLEISLTVPGVISGKGRLQVGASGNVDAMLAVDVDAVGVGALARVVISPPNDAGQSMVHVEVNTRFASGLPLLGTGAAIYGFDGRFVAHGTRAVDRNKDRVEAELTWFASGANYTFEEDSYAFGVGVVVGTLPDGGFSFHAIGSLAVQVPEFAFVLGLDGKFLQLPRAVQESTDDLEPGDVRAGVTGLLVIDADAVILAVDGFLEISKLLELKVPLRAFFPFEDTQRTYLRIGSDGYDGRAGEPISMTILPDILGMKAFAFLMFEGMGFPRGMYGDPDFVLHGFSIGFGAGFGHTWSAGPFSLGFSATLLAGLGTKPFFLRATLRIEGSLDLVILALGVSAELSVGVSADESYIEGKVCGRIKFLFWTLKGCVGLRIGNEPKTRVPPAPDLVEQVALMDRYGRALGEAPETSSGGPVVWPDTLLALKLRRPPQVGLGGENHFEILETTGAVFTGTNDVKYAYRLTGVTLVREGDPESQKDLPASWALRLLADGTPDPDSPPSASEHESRLLVLLTADLPSSQRSLLLVDEETPGDPASYAEDLCEPAPAPTRACVLGAESWTDTDKTTITLYERTHAEGPYPSRFTLSTPYTLGDLDPDRLAQLFHVMGFDLVLHDDAALPFPIDHGESSLDRGLCLSHARRFGLTYMTAPWEGTFHAAVQEPELTLAVRLQFPELKPTTQCLDFTDMAAGTILGPTYSIHGATLEQLAQDLQVFDRGGDGKGEVKIISKGAILTLPEGSRNVRVTVLQASSGHREEDASLLAFDADGVEVEVHDLGGVTGRWVTVVFDSANIRRIRITGASEIYFRKACWFGPRSFREVLLEAAAALKETAPSLVQGVRTDGTIDDWPGTTISVRVHDELPRLDLAARYTAPHSGPYQAVRTPALPLIQVWVVSACGVSLDAAEASARDQRHRDQVRDQLNDAHDHATGAIETEEDARQLHWVLQPDSAYTLTVHYQAAVWEKKDGDIPTAATAFDGLTGTSQTFAFRTAPLLPAVEAHRQAELAQQPLPALPDADLSTHETFDPRALHRYLLGLDPGDEERAFFRMDPMEAHFDQPQLPLLLDRYGYYLKLRVVRTDPPPGAYASLDHAPTVADIVQSWMELPEVLWSAVDQRFAAGLAEAPCVEGPPAPGSTAVAVAPLDPYAEYDFEVVAMPFDASDPRGVVIRRSHFRTGGFVDAEALVGSLDLDTSGGIGIAPPADAIATGALPTDEQLDDDEQLEAALRSAGLDPLPIPGAGRVLAIWRRTPDGWAITGVLLDATEPLRRAIRMGDDTRRLDVASGRIELPGRQTRRTQPPPFVLDAPLKPVRSNKTGTRILLANTGDSLPDGSRPDLLGTLTITFTRSTGDDLVGRTSLLPVPRLVWQEEL